jgi:excisionase family DNA binding protein
VDGAREWLGRINVSNEFKKPKTTSEDAGNLSRTGRRIQSTCSDERPFVENRLAYSPEEATRVASVGRSLIFKEIRDGRLIARKVGRRTIIAADDLQAWLKSLPKKKRVVAIDRAAEFAT